MRDFCSCSNNTQVSKKINIPRPTQRYCAEYLEKYETFDAEMPFQYGFGNPWMLSDLCMTQLAVIAMQDRMNTMTILFDLNWLQEAQTIKNLINNPQRPDLWIDCGSLIKQIHHQCLLELLFRVCYKNIQKRIYLFYVQSSQFLGSF